jgi:hypothetical protein
VPVPSEKNWPRSRKRRWRICVIRLLAQAKLPPRENQIARPAGARTRRRTQRVSARHLHHQGKPHLRPGARRRGEGNGDADLCVFGERVTPNEHKLVRDFVLLDNTYCCGHLSADGHQWTDSGMATDYVEREFAGWPRSYPGGGFGEGGKDALAYSPAGFIWDDALAHGKTVVISANSPRRSSIGKFRGAKDENHFLDAYRDFISGSNALPITCEPDIEALRPFIVTNTVGWDLDVPDVFRAAKFIKGVETI